MLACSSCHLAHHRGLLTISGTAEHLEVHRPGDARHDTSSHAARATAIDREPAGSPALAAAPIIATSAHVGARASGGTRATAIDREPAGSPALASLPMVAASAHVGARASGGARAAAIDREPAGKPALADAPIVVTNAHVGALTAEPSGGKLAAAMLRAQAKAALTGLGWKPAIAQAAVAAAAAQCGEVTLEQLIFQSLRRCPVPRV